MYLVTTHFDKISLDLLFGWFFKFINGLYRILRHDMNFSFAGIEFSMWEVLCVFIVLHLMISAFVKAGGARDV